MNTPDPGNLDDELKALQEESLRLTEALGNDLNLEPLLTKPSRPMDRGRGGISSSPATASDEKNRSASNTSVPGTKTPVSGHDAFFRVELGEKSSTASLFLYPATGTGKKADAAEILAAIKKKGINFGLQDEVVRKVVAEVNETNHPVDGMVIARAQEPVDGTDATLETVVEFKSKENFLEAHPDEHLPSTQEYSGYALVQAGSRLVKIQPDTKGREGATVTGKVLPAKHGKNPFYAGDNILEKMEQDSLFFLSKIDGIAVFQGNNYSVLPFRETAIRIRLLDNEFKAHLVIAPPADMWKPPTLTRIHEEIKKAGVTYGLKYEVVEKEFNAFLQDKQPRDFLIAEGDLPEDGEDGSLEFHLPIEKKTVVSPDEKGRIDYRHRLNVILVEKDTLVCTLRTPTKATRNAITVKNRTVGARDGEPARFAALGGLREEKVDARTSRFYSELNGELDFNPVRGELRVSQSKTVDAIDMTLGNLNYVGNVTVNQNIEDGMEVHVKGDLYVKGLIMGAKVTVSGNVSCEGGVITKENGFLRLNGDLRARFIENSNIRALGEIQVERAILNSQVATQKSLIAISERSYVLGGVLQVRERATLRYLGNESGVKAVVQLGSDLESLERYQEILTRMRQLKDDAVKFDLVIQKLLSAGKLEEMSEKNKTAYKKLLLGKNSVIREMKDLRDEGQGILQGLEATAGAELNILGKVFADNTVRFGTSKIVTEGVDAGVSFYQDQDTREIRKRSVKEKELRESASPRDILKENPSDGKKNPKKP